DPKPHLFEPRQERLRGLEQREPAIVKPSKRGLSPSWSLGRRRRRRKPLGPRRGPDHDMFAPAMRLHENGGRHAERPIDPPRRALLTLIRIDHLKLDRHGGIPAPPQKRPL